MNDNFRFNTPSLVLFEWNAGCLQKLDHTISSKRLELRQTVAKTRIALEALSTVEEKEELERKLEEAETTLGGLVCQDLLDWLHC